MNVVRFREWHYGPLRVRWFRQGWHTKPHPYWFARRFSGGMWSVQSGPVEVVWWRV